MIRNYKIVEAGDPDELRTRVLQASTDGWEPQGGVVVVALGDDEYLYVQALVKT